ncbi:MAG: hypothetical protein GXP47_03265 [Acidobacteria bacterium]|nr:hypothetical protein [Acidobacteriota bacterium]
MARLARLKLSHHDTWYHLHSRIAGHRGEYVLDDELCRRRLIGIIEHYSSIYFCQVAALCVMGNHYHLVLRFEAEREVSRKELRVRAEVMYPGKAGLVRIEAWTDEDWEHYRHRLFDVSEYMRNVQAAFARWYNRAHDRRGRFWADRFKSVILGDARAVVDCVLYVELNPVRAGVVVRPEEWKGSSVYLRELGHDGWLLPLGDLLGIEDRDEAVVRLRALLYHRGAVPTKEGQARIPQEVLEQEAARGFEAPGAFRKRLAFFVDGLMVGTEGFIREQLAVLREEEYFRRRKNPISQLGGIHRSLREQRSHAIVF